MAGSTSHQLPLTSRLRGGRVRSRYGARVAALSPPSHGDGELIVLMLMILLVVFGPLVWKVAINDIDFTRGSRVHH